MKASELIIELEKIKAVYGDLPVEFYDHYGERVEVYSAYYKEVYGWLSESQRGMGVKIILLS